MPATKKPMSTDAILFWTMVFPSLFLLVVFCVGVVVLASTVGENYHPQTISVEDCPDAQP